MNSALNINEIRYRIDDYITFCLGNEESLCFLKDKELELYDAMETFLQRKAKRLRPILLMLAFNGYSSKNNPTVIHAAVALELMHTFALIHDDIIDGTKTRDSIPSLNHAIEKLAIKRKHAADGDGMAMLIGDLIYNIALMEFQKVKVSDSIRLKSMELLLSIALKTGHGQLLEMVDVFHGVSLIDKDEVFNIYDLKTASYTFCLPLKMGAMLAGQNKQEQKKLDDIGLKLGRAFQIIDDINDFDPVDQNPYNLLSALLFDKADRAEKTKLRKVLAGKSRDKTDINFLKDLYYKYEVICHSTRIALEFIDEAVTGIRKLSLNDTIKKELIDYIGSIMKIQR